MDASAVVGDKDSMVDPFLVEVLQNPRHRLTVLRMELEIRKFMQNADQKVFEFQHFPTSYLRLAAHRVAQHYGLQTMVQDTSLDGIGNRILVIKTVESKFSAIRLSNIPIKQSENEKSEQIKFVIRTRPGNISGSEGNESGVKSSLRSVEERKEEYDRARARIFNSPCGSDSDDMSSSALANQTTISFGGDENEACRISAAELDKTNWIRESSSSSKVAILKDREKDRTDPDYDRSYERYARIIPSQSFGSLPFNMQNFNNSFGHYDAGFPQLSKMPRPSASINYIAPPSPVMIPFGGTGLSQGSRDAAYAHWPTASVMHIHSYDQFRHGVFQAPIYQQPLSFDYTQNP
ncbi:hypothetical protein SAY87_010004 [Trapa incisa]|uniref:Single-stranded nucleic acid binding R3H protein n=1 Tax=Trapa incisa TaxID=236973 RepID=A0AAN7JHL9_9MYRT|nr:hypothetical protein SAY87_010004 [Trapa incisa]